ncbi:hypothetical protein FPZ12_014340 [Amycolatopsis acidicola]|uniref:Uncharacterized protein n=1 Tax=Amycolatopsis acidicola TaxID=2596893 RepID=A0A5N0V6F6_9PSEU|nr:BTAD domain-containing putative transcriptional regulator [Amycolatopsis acidicola]KAA9161324.1 hypothetical protein FPZ12_014340 [Amycolatopsis acidicola]
MQFHVLGPIEACTSAGTPVEPAAAKPRALLAVLLLHANAWVGVDQLIDAIWHEQAVPSSAVRNLRSYVWQLRKTFGDRLASRPGAYRLTVLPGETDTDELDSLVESARAAMDQDEYATAAEKLTAALALWRGSPFEELALPAAQSAAARLTETRCELSCLLSDAYLELGRATDATVLLTELGEQHPLRETVWTRLVLALHAAGRPAEALATYDRARRTLLRELGVEPGAELVAAQRKVLREREPATPRLSLVGGHAASGHTGVDSVLASATDEVLVMTTGTGSGPIDVLRRLGRSSLKPGVRYRVLCPDSARLSGALGSLSMAGVDVRTDSEVPMEAVVIDRSAVVLPADRAGSPTGVAIFRLPGVVAATTGLFERMWPTAVPLLADANDTALNRRERDLLTLLCAGSTDESAAARLGISVRTVRRMVADIMNRLGARSRFQAGVKAADRGWLMDKAG